MKLQTYEVIRDDLTIFADVGEHRPIKAGQIVYAWPYPDWGLCSPNEVAIVTAPMDVMTVYALPRSALAMRAVVDLSMSVHDGMQHAPCIVRPDPA